MEINPLLMCKDICLTCVIIYICCNVHVFWKIKCYIVISSVMYAWFHKSLLGFYPLAVTERGSHHNHLPNSLVPGKFEWNFRHVIFKQILVIDGWSISCEIALIWMSLDFTDDQSTLVQVMAWCRLATSHYLSQCWPRSLSPCGVTRT